MSYEVAHTLGAGQLRKTPLCEGLMKIHLEIEPSDVQCVQQLLDEMRSTNFVQARIARNVKRLERPRYTRTAIWHAHVS